MVHHGNQAKGAESGEMKKYGNDNQKSEQKSAYSELLRKSAVLWM
jgi:hypothetical protein